MFRLQSVKLRKLVQLTIITTFLFAGLLLALSAAPTVAAPPGQTVPIPTPTLALPQPEATATPAGNNESGGDADTPIEPEDEEGALPPAGGGIPMAEGDVAFPARTGADPVPVYAGPGTRYEQLGTLPPATEVEVLGRDTGLAWFVVCCLPDGQAGWVHAHDLLGLTVGNQIRLPITSDWRAEPRALAEPAQDGAATTLQLSAAYTPTMARPGDEALLQIVVKNPETQPVSNVRVRSTLPAALEYVDGQTTSGKITPPDAAALEPSFEVEWARLAAETAYTTTITVTVTGEASDKSVIEQIIAAQTADTTPVTARAVVALPPSALPDFR